MYLIFRSTTYNLYKNVPNHFQLLKFELKLSGSVKFEIGGSLVSDSQEAL